jgi:hypothetical protein
VSLTAASAAVEFEHAAMAAVAQDLYNHAVGRWLVPIEPPMAPTEFEACVFPPYPLAPTEAASDFIGRGMRDAIPDAVAGCRLGCACAQHTAPKQPYVPSVTDWDLLPDAVAK